MTTEPHEGPLRGLRVIDLATVFAGPSAARRLADFGADVIKVERTGDGDGARHLGETDGEDGYYWRLVGRNKRPIELDLKHEQGREVLLRLIRTADVLIENFRPGALERLGLDPESVLLVENPGLVILRVTGFGQDGPYSSRAGFGTIAEAMSTLAYTTGQADGPPTLPPIALADEITGALSAFAILAAIRHRDLTGEGQVIDATLLDSMLDVVGPGAAIAHRTGVSDQRIGSDSGSRLPATSTSARMAGSACLARRTQSPSASSMSSVAKNSNAIFASQQTPTASPMLMLWML